MSSVPAEGITEPARRISWDELLAKTPEKDPPTLAELAEDALAPVGDVLLAMLEDQALFNVATFGGPEEYEEGRDRYEVSEPADAHVASSLVRSIGEFDKGQHRVVLDIDHPVHAVPSSTPGHFHLYIDAPPIPDAVYWKLVDVLVEAGIVEPGYASASKARGHTDVRLPWVRKPVQPEVTTKTFEQMLEEA